MAQQIEAQRADSLHELQDQAVECANSLVRRMSASSDQEALLLHSIQIKTGATAPLRPLVVAPLLVHACISGSTEPALPIAAAAHFLDRSIAILDSFMDGDPMPEWAERGPGQALLAATTVLGALPMAALAQLEALPAKILELQGILTLGGLRVSSGQQLDLALRGTSHPELQQALDAATGKTGEMMATVGRLAASLASDDADLVEAFADTCRDYGTAWQIDSDLRDVLDPERSRDLANGTRTLPIAAYLEVAPESARAEPIRLALPGSLASGEGATGNESAAVAAVAYCISVSEGYTASASRRLDALRLLEPAGSMLRLLLFEASEHRGET
ncbi:MAG: polyprenyl synthetase family protein [Dehalococcoidia bacterium]